jgi:AraC-like DNA-binding protein
MVVESVLKNLGIDYTAVEIGSIQLPKAISAEKMELLRTDLMNCGLEMVEDKKSILIEKIKAIIVDFVYNDNDLLKVNFSEYLEEKLHYDYTYLSNVFSEITAVSIINYTIALKIERVKELLVYGDHTLSEISYKLNYSSAAHLSNQFKKHTGLSPSSFKNIQQLKKAYAASQLNINV